MRKRTVLWRKRHKQSDSKIPFHRPASQDEWAERASTFLKAKLKESEVTYVELAKRLKKHGFAETEASITNKLKRGTFSATFFPACLAALELEGVALEEI